MPEIHKALMSLKLMVIFVLVGCSSKATLLPDDLLSTKVLPMEGKVTIENLPSATLWLVTRTPLLVGRLTSTSTPLPSQTKPSLPSGTSPLYPTFEIALTLTPTPAGVDWTEAGKYVGEQRMICGTVAGTHYASSSRGKPTFLNLGEDYPNPRRFVVLIWGEYRRNFPEPPESFYLDKDICVSGVITEYKGIFEVEIRSPEEITVHATD